MAKIMTTAIVADLRKKLNGSVFSSNRYGPYVRSKVTPFNPNTQPQQAARSRFAAASTAWKTLNENQRQSWIDAGINFPIRDVFGNQRILTANSLFTSLNTNLLTIDEPMILVAPTPSFIPAFLIKSLFASSSPQRIEIGYKPPSPGPTFKLLIKSTPSMLPSRSFFKNHLVNIFTQTLPAAASIVIEPSFAPLIPDLIAGMKLHITASVISVLTGQAGVPVTASTVIT